MAKHMMHAFEYFIFPGLIFLCIAGPLLLSLYELRRHDRPPDGDGPARDPDPDPPDAPRSPGHRPPRPSVKHARLRSPRPTRRLRR